jgi:hypothetical protein
MDKNQTRLCPSPQRSSPFPRQKRGYVPASKTVEESYSYSHGHRVIDVNQVTLPMNVHIIL